MLTGKIAIVTGASRGIGAGIARELAANGATVVLAARTAHPENHVAWSDEGGPTVTGSLADNVSKIKSTGGKAEAYPIDLLENTDIEKLVAYVTKKYGSIDILANCAMGFPKSYKAFVWDDPDQDWTAMMDVGVRSKYVITSLVSNVMRQQRNGLIVNISAAASKDEYYSPVFRMAMACVDRMTSAIATDLRDYGVSAVSIWPRWVRTERVMMATQDDSLGFDVTTDDLVISDTPEFTGRAIVHLAADPEIHRHSGKTFPVVQLAHEYQFDDLDGSRPPIDDYTRQWIQKLALIQNI